jgi:hypothetical protein
MIVRVTQLRHPHGYEIESHQRLRVGGDYLVVGINVRPRGPTFRIVDDLKYPFDSSLWPLAMFEVVSPNISTIWRVAIEVIQENTYLYIGPEQWLRPGFWDDFLADPPQGIEAKEQYGRDVLHMMAEEGLGRPD